ncbi:unnamed protein product [Vicia faba]|uniref:TF-B3 domain-containing protein n=1 Tax=Vicia faba TaxID=3906 RepID=A0AAV0ZJ28_VICFA|nr:unnamed protein product [Vicia faba]
MGRNPKVCTSCIHHCRMFHRPHPTTTTQPTSFYKFMLHQNHLKLLYLPPKLKRTMSGLVGKNVTLEDSSGGRFYVTVSDVDGSLAFKEGWNVFSLDHKLEVGDLVVFNCIDKLKFGVKIYDESVCERVDFSKRRIRKKRDRNGEFIRKDPNASLANFQTENVLENGNVDGRVEYVRALGYIEDTCFTTSHAFQNDASFYNKDPMFEEVLGTGDTSYALKLELLGRNNCAMQHKYPAMTLVENNERESKGEVQEGSDQAAISKGKHALHAFELETSGRNNSLGDSDKIAYEKTSILKHKENKEGKSFFSKKEIQECQFAEGLGERKKVPMNMNSKRRRPFNDKLCATELPKVKGKLNQNNEGHFETGATISCENTKERFNKKSNLLDDCIYLGETPVETTPKLCSIDDKINVTGLTEVKRDLKEDKTTATVTDNNSLELSEPLPLSCVGKGSKKMVVYLKDPLTRKWPVLCNEKTRFTSGWSDFQRANSIKTGDVCVFKVENKYESIVAVHTDHK